jgi:hypothetical protein
MRVFSVEMLVKEEGAAVVEAALKRLKGETAAVAAQMKTTTSQVTSTGKAMRDAGAGTQIAGDRAAKAAIGFAAVGQSIARTGSLTADAGTRIIEAGSQIATMFGPGGLVVAALLSAGVAISMRMKQARDEIEQTKKSFDELADVGNVAGLKKQLAELTVGRPSQNYQDGIIALSTELAKLKDKYQGVVFGLDGLTAASRRQILMNADLSRQEKDDLIRIGELNSKIREKNELVARLNVLLPIASSVAAQNADTTENETAALKELNEELALTNVNRKELIYGIRETSREMDANARSVRAAAAAYEGRLSQRIQTELKAAPLQSSDIERIARDAQAATERYRLQNAVQMDLDVTIGEITSGGVDIDQKLLKAIRADNIKTTLADGIRDAVEGGLTSGLEMAMAGGSLSDSFKAMGQAITQAMASAMAKVALAAIGFGTLLEKIQKFMMKHPALAVASAVAMLALARSMGGGASGADMVGTGGAGGLTYSAASSAAPTQQIIFGATSATTAAGMTPRSSTNVTIIGPNDPSAQRAMQELMAKADSRGRLG